MTDRQRQWFKEAFPGAGGDYFSTWENRFKNGTSMQYMDARSSRLYFSVGYSRRIPGMALPRKKSLPIKESRYLKAGKEYLKWFTLHYKDNPSD